MPRASAVSDAGLADAEGADGGAPSLFTLETLMVPMRDGVKLETAVIRPRDAKGPLPVLLRRTPYGVPKEAPTVAPSDYRALAADGYVFVIQNLRGRFGSEGTFTLADDSRVEPGKGTIETRDAYDAIDWLVKNLPGTTGKVGIFGVSYDGYTAAAALLGPHPALRAVSAQASPVDQWRNDDFHRFGALRLSYSFEYAVLEEAEKAANTTHRFDVWDTFDWYLHEGPLVSLDERRLLKKLPFWQSTVTHPNRDPFWKSLAWVEELHASTVPNLNVAGFWDQEDPWGPWQIFRHAAERDPDGTNLIVAGPWCHGCWRGEEKTLGPVDLGQDTAKAYLEEIEAPFFAYWLHGKGEKPAYRAKTFQTGSNTWKTYDAWPPKSAKPTSLYFHADGTLRFEAPAATARGAKVSWVSDPNKPVPYRARPISPTYPGGDWTRWESDDQRFVDGRPDVLTFTSAALAEDLVVSGEVSADLWASTTGTDADMVVKLIDVFPEDAQKPSWPTDLDSPGPDAGAYAKSPNGYQLPIAMEVRRGRFLESEEHPAPLHPREAVNWPIPLRDRDHVFKKGHRMMVQVQSTWFPLIDRNPQTFVPNILLAKSSDFVAATHAVHCEPGKASRVVLPVVGRVE